MGQRFDVVVVGGGPGGYVCAIRCAQLGMRVACVEKRVTLGGTCLNVGCIPSKALLESSHHFAQVVAGDFVEHGVQFDGVRLDLEAMQQRKQRVVAQITGGVDYLVGKNKITRLVGHARLRSATTLEVDGGDRGVELVEAERMVLATGSVPVEISVAPFDHRVVLDSTDALELAEVPRSFAVIGGGAIGLEMGSVWARLGAQVSVFEAQDSILPSMDAALQREMTKLLTQQGLRFETGAQVSRVDVVGDEAQVTYQRRDGSTHALTVHRVLVAVGRRPMSEGLGLENLGIATDRRGAVQVDERFETGCRGVFAIGDLIAGPMLAHKAEEDGIAVAEILAGQSGHVDYRKVPSVVYTWPEVAALGYTEQELKTTGTAYRTGKFMFKANGRAQAAGHTPGFVRIYSDATSGRVLGCHIVGAHASELIAEVGVALEFGASTEDLARTMHAHPTLSEALKEAALDAEGRVIHA